MEQDHLSEVEFASLDLPEPLRRGIADAGFVKCTPIQAEALPLALAGRDIAGQAQTGTGKSAAFLLAAFNHMLLNPPPEGRKKTQPRCVILAPTRELAVQIHKDSVVLGKHTGFKQVLVFGGTGYEQQRNDLEAGVDVLIGTPGRLIDYFKQGVFDMRQVQVAILDEADRMFDLGFIDDIRYVLRKMPAADQRLNMLFSATLSQKVLELAYEDMNEPVSVSIEPEKVTADRIRQVVYHTANDEKLPLLVHLLRSDQLDRTIVFVNMKREAEKVQAWLNENGIHAEQISGDVPQRKRLALMKQFSNGDLPVLVATDVASRGLHIPDVSHVVNYDLPQDAEDYVHRIGRTARAGASGDAISFGCENYAFHMPEIEAYVGFQIPVESFDHDSLPELKRPPMRPRRDSGGRGGRGGRGGESRGGQSSGRGGRSGGGGGGGGGGRGRRRDGSQDPQREPRRDEPRDQESNGSKPSAVVADQQNRRPKPEQAGQAAGEDGAPRKKRRRRRGGRGRNKDAGQQGQAAAPQEAPKKKGFFARLLGL
jgi:ATP-dependent RNA helicase RhlB